MEIEDGESVEGDVLPKASTKKKPAKVEENRSKKEHVNVVFIGHVGELEDGDCGRELHANLTLSRRWKINNRRTNHVTNRNG